MTKKEIDFLKEKLDDKAEEKKRQLKDEFLDDEDMGDQQQEIIDEEELAYLQQMKDFKKQYRENFEQLKQQKSEVSYIQNNIDLLKQ